MKKIRILSIDGGGIRGIFPGVILSYLEKQVQHQTRNPNYRLADMFDYFAGTSTGGILSLCYLIPNKYGRPKYSAQDAVDIYLQNGTKIFKLDFWQLFKSGFGLLDEKYNAKALEEVFLQYFGDTLFIELLKPCVITSYDLAKAKPYFFRQHKSLTPADNFLVRDIARATSAAPVYFEAARIFNFKNTAFSLIDGGVIANNPSLVAYSEVRNMHFGFVNNPTAAQLFMLSIGTATKAQTHSFDEAKKWGALQWLNPIFEILVSGNSATVNHHLQQIFASVPQGQLDYHRLEPVQVLSNKEMDNASKENLDNLVQDANNYLNQPKVIEELNTIASQLIKYGQM